LENLERLPLLAEIHRDEDQTVLTLFINSEIKYESYRKVFVFKRIDITAEASYYKEQFDTDTNTMKRLWVNLNSKFALKTY